MNPGDIVLYHGKEVEIIGILSFENMQTGQVVERVGIATPLGTNYVRADQLKRLPHPDRKGAWKECPFIPEGIKP